MIVGIDGHALGDQSGGNETYCRNLIKNFSAEETEQMVLFIRKNHDENLPEFKGRIVHFKTENPLIRNFIEIPYLMLKYKISVMHMFYFIPFVRFCPVVVTIHDISFEHFSDIFTKKDYLAQKKLIPYAARKSSKITTISEYSKKDICEHYGVDKSKVINAKAAVSADFRKLLLTEAEVDRMKQRFGIGDKFILCVGNLQPRKNIKRLIEAYSLLRKHQVSDVDLVIVGKKAWMYEDMFNNVENEQIKKHIILTDYVTEEELIKLYNMAEIFVYPSVFEGFGLPVLEAIACQTPAAASNITSIPEVAGEAAVLFDPYDVSDICSKLELLLTDEELRMTCRQKSLIQSKNFSWRLTAEKTFRVYKNLATRT